VEFAIHIRVGEGYEELWLVEINFSFEDILLRPKFLSFTLNS